MLGGGRDGMVDLATPRARVESERVMADTFKLTRDASGALVLAATGNPAVVVAVGSVLIAGAFVAWFCAKNDGPGKGPSRVDTREAGGRALPSPAEALLRPALTSSDAEPTAPMPDWQRIEQQRQEGVARLRVAPPPQPDWHRIEQQRQEGLARMREGNAPAMAASGPPEVQPAADSTPRVEPMSELPKPPVDAATEGAFAAFLRSLSPSQRADFVRAFTSPPEAMVTVLNACSLSPDQVGGLLKALGHMASAPPAA